LDSPRKTEQKLQITSATAWLILALGICYMATSLGAGAAHEPGSGFVFLWSGLLLAVLALILFASFLRNRHESATELHAIAWGKVLAVLTALLLYGIFLEKIGFVASSFLLLILLARLGGATRWVSIVTIAAVAALSTFILFDVWLNIRLPKGMFGI
jgi:hypothetical protein